LVEQLVKERVVAPADGEALTVQVGALHETPKPMTVDPVKNRLVALPAPRTVTPPPFNPAAGQLPGEVHPPFASNKLMFELAIVKLPEGIEMNDPGGAAIRAAFNDAAVTVPPETVLQADVVH
jgi:hypothetical protein